LPELQLDLIPEFEEEKERQRSKSRKKSKKSRHHKEDFY
jgi:hypothetical protein